MGLGLLEDLADGVARMPEFAGDLADGLAIAPGSSYGTVVVHRKHVLDPPEGESSAVRTFTLPEVSYGGSVLRAQIAPRWVSFTRSVPLVNGRRVPAVTVTAMPTWYAAETLGTTHP